LWLAALATFGLAPIQEEVSVGDQGLLFQLSQQYSEAMELFRDPQRQSQSIEFLSQIIRAIDDERRMRDQISDELKGLQEQCFEHRARAYFNAGQLQGAGDDFRQLILANPRYALNEEELSPKIIDFFEDRKKQLVGFIAVNSEPPGARVTVNGDFVGITNFFPVEVHTGLAGVEIELVGHDPISREEVNILPGETRTIDVVLVRNSAKLPIITQPADVEIWVDGELVGKTAGNLPRDLRSFMPAEYDVEQLSAPFDLAAIPVGRHTIEFRRDCYESAQIGFEAEEPKDYTAQIIRLEDSIGQLRLTSTPDGARVFIDGEYKGNTPLDLSRVCSGPHHVEVKHPTGKYVEDIELGRDEDLSLECPIRPSLAFFGIAAEPGVSNRDQEDVRQKVTAELQKLTAMNLLHVSAEQARDLLGRDGLMTFVSKDVAGDLSRADPERVRDLSDKVGESLEVEALLVGYIPAQKLTKDVVFNLLATGSTAPDTFTVNYLDREAMPAFVELLTSSTPIYGSWIGLQSVDTHLRSGSIVLKIGPDGPAAQAGIELGDVIVEVEGEPIKDTLALLTKVGAKEPGDTLSIKLQRQGTSRDAQISVGMTPLEIPMNRSGFLYNKAIIDLRHRMVVEPSVEPLARLNLALCHMELGNYETALREHLPRITLPAEPGISQGTVYYHTGVCYERLDEKAEAVRMFREALQFPEATVQSNDGPRVTPLAERKLRELGQ
jgi:tetratricopeptide (TPR) repeat protein